MIQEILLFNDVPLFCINTGDGQGKEKAVAVHTARFNFQKKKSTFLLEQSVCVFVCLVCKLISQRAVIICPLSTD